MTLQHELKKKHAFQSPAQEAYLNLCRTHAALSAAFAQLFKEHGLSETTYNILRVLRGVHEFPEQDQDRLPCHEIADRLITRVPDITRLLDRLENAGLVSRQRCTVDRRVVWAGITSAGLGLLADLDRPVAELHRDQLGHLSDPQLHKLSRLLTKAREPAHAPSV